MDWLLQLSDPNLDWGYAMVTLLVRFVGVFVVMLVMQIALQATAVVIRRIEARGEAASVVPSAAPAPSLDLGIVDEQHPAAAEVAAIGLALAQEAQTPPRIIPGGFSAWSAAGRLRQVGRPLR